MSLTKEERETVISYDDEHPNAIITTHRRPDITRLKKNPAAEMLEEGVHDGTAYAQFSLPKELLTFRRPRAASKGRGGNADALAKARAARSRK